MQFVTCITLVMLELCWMMLRCWGYVMHECGQVSHVVLNKSMTFGQGKGILLAVLTSVLHMAQLSFPFQVSDWGDIRSSAVRVLKVRIFPIIMAVVIVRYILLINIVIYMQRQRNRFQRSSFLKMLHHKQTFTVDRNYF